MKKFLITAACALTIALPASAQSVQPEDVINGLVNVYNAVTNPYPGSAYGTNGATYYSPNYQNQYPTQTYNQTYYPNYGNSYSDPYNNGYYDNTYYNNGYNNGYYNNGYYNNRNNGLTEPARKR